MTRTPIQHLAKTLGVVLMAIGAVQALSEESTNAELPEMVVIPAGEFEMGCLNEGDFECRFLGPKRRVKIGYSFALSKYEVTFGQWTACVEAGGCGGWRPLETARRGWRASYGPSHPVFRVSWDDAQSYLGWLSEETGQSYRLPSEAEWEYAAGAETETRWHFGDDPSELCIWGNVADTVYVENYRRLYPRHPPADCTDGFVYAAPVGSFRPNPFGLYDVYGNVFEWVQDCYRMDYRGAPRDGRALEWEGCEWRTWRGGSWAAGREGTPTRRRLGGPPTSREVAGGFRVARTLGPSMEPTEEVAPNPAK